MAFYRCGGGGIPSSLKTDMNAVFNKKFGTAVDYPPEGWPDDVNLMGPLPEKTIVSSPIADFSDGADDVPTKAVKISIPPTLSGVSSVSETQTGRNLFDNELTTKTVNGTTFTVNADKSITISGTPSATTRVYISRQSIEIKAGSFFSFGTMPTGTRVFCSRTSSGSTTYPTISPSHTATIGAEYTNFLLEVLTTFDGTNFTIYPQLEFGSTAHAYEPYTTPTQYTANLGRTIYGGTADIVNGTGKETHGKKVFDGTEGTGGTPSWTMISVTQGTMFRITVSDKATTSATNTLCSFYTPVAQAQRADGTVSGAGTNVDIIDNRFSSVDAFKAWLAENPVILVYKLATPTDFTFTGQEINTRLGYNAFWSDEGDTEVTYRADINLALGGQ